MFGAQPVENPGSLAAVELCDVVYRGEAGNPFHPSESPVIRLSGIDGQEYLLTELQIISIIVLYISWYKCKYIMFLHDGNNLFN